jgi:hypothetical protein
MLPKEEEKFYKLVFKYVFLKLVVVYLFVMYSIDYCI